MNWQPWNDYKPQKEELLPIEAPPCANCAFWKPIRVYDDVGAYNGVRLCHVLDGQCRDFSCYKPREEK